MRQLRIHLNEGNIIMEMDFEIQQGGGLRPPSNTAEIHLHCLFHKGL